jgi:hypothetical protein
MTEKDRLSETAIANKRRYDQEYWKEHYKMFSVGVPIEEYEDYMKMIKNKKMTKVEFLRKAFKYIKDNNIEL